MEQWLDKIVELLHFAYEKENSGKDFSPEGYDEVFKKLSSTLNDEQQELLREFDLGNMELLINHEKNAIRYLLSLMCQEQ